MNRLRTSLGLVVIIALPAVATPSAGAATPPLSPFNLAQWSGFVVVDTDAASPLAGGPANKEVDTYRATTRYNKTLHPTLSGTIEHHSHIETLIGAAVCATDVWWPDDSGVPFTIPETLLDPVTGGQIGTFAIFGDSGEYSVSPSFLFRRLVPELTIKSGTGVGCPPESRTTLGIRTNFPLAPRIGLAPIPVGNVTRLEGSYVAPPDGDVHFCWRVTWLPDGDHDGIPDAEDPAPAVAGPATCAAITPPHPAPSAEAACVTSVLVSAKVTKAATLLKRRGFRITCHASAPRTLTVALTTVVRGHRITIAILKERIAKAGAVTRTVRLTKAGRRLLRRSRRRIRATLKVTCKIGPHTATKAQVVNIAPLKR